MNIYLLDSLYIIAILVAILIYRSLYGWKFVLFTNYPTLYIIFYIIILGLPLIYSLYKFVETRNDPSKDRPITASKWMGALFVMVFIIIFNVAIYPSLKNN